MAHSDRQESRAIPAIEPVSRHGIFILSLVHASAIILASGYYVQGSNSQAICRAWGASRLEKCGVKVVFQWNPVEEGSSVRSELDELFHQLKDNGVKAITYHITPPFYSQTSKRSSVFHSGYPEEIINAYLDPEIFDADPIPDHVLAAGHVMTWRQAIAGQILTEKHRNYVSKAIELGFIDGVAVPLFGPLSRNAYMSMNFGKTISSEDEEVVRPLVGIAQSCHRRVCAIINQTAAALPALSQRESEVLYWISRGKSNGDMAIILAISEATIDTYIRRLFKKLGVHDRISAVIIGLSSSLIKLR